MLATYIFNEVSPSSPGTATSVNLVESSASWAPAGVAGGMLDDADALDIAADLVGATGGTLDVLVQSSPDAGHTWRDAVHFTTLASGASALHYRVGVSVLSTETAPVVAGDGTLASGAVVQGPWGDRLRLKFIAGTGTTAGAPVKVTIAAMRSYRRP